MSSSDSGDEGGRVHRYTLSKMSKNGKTLTHICTFDNISRPHAYFNYLTPRRSKYTLEARMRKGSNFHRFSPETLPNMMKIMRNYGFIDRVRLVKIWSWKKPLRVKYTTKTWKNMPPLVRPTLEQRMPQDGIDLVKSFIGNVETPYDRDVKSKMRNRTNLKSKDADKIYKLIQKDLKDRASKHLLGGLGSLCLWRLRGHGVSGIPYSQRLGAGAGEKGESSI